MHCTPGCGDSAYRVVHLSHLCSCFNADLKSLSASSYYYLSWSKLSVPLPREDSNNVLISFYFKINFWRVFIVVMYISLLLLRLMSNSYILFVRLRLVKPEKTKQTETHMWQWLCCNKFYLFISVNFCRAMLCKRGLCCHAVSVCLSVCLCVSVTFIHSVKTN